MPALLPLLHLQDLTPMIRNHRRRRQECIPSDYIESLNISLRSFLQTRSGTMHFLPTPAKTLPGKFFPERTSFGGSVDRVNPTSSVIQDLFLTRNNEMRAQSGHGIGISLSEVKRLRGETPFASLG